LAVWVLGAGWLMMKRADIADEFVDYGLRTMAIVQKQ